MKRKLFTIIGLLCNSLLAIACPVCERNQPKVLKGISHGEGPESNWDYVIVWIMVAIVLLTLLFSIAYLIRPREKSNFHIKRFILNAD